MNSPTSFNFKLIDEKSSYESKINYDKLKEISQTPTKFPDKNEFNKKRNDMISLTTDLLKKILNVHKQLNHQIINYDHHRMNSFENYFLHTLILPP